MHVSNWILTEEYIDAVLSLKSEDLHVEVEYTFTIFVDLRMPSNMCVILRKAWQLILAHHVASSDS